MRDQEHLTEALADRYRTEREIGRGGMATVYLARRGDTKLLEGEDAYLMLDRD
jgi:hypothetical protein